MPHETVTTPVVRAVGAVDSAGRAAARASGRALPWWRDALQTPSSRSVLVPALAALWAVGHGTDRPDLSRVARQGLLAIALGAVFTKTIKRVVCRARPNQGGDPERWGIADGKRASFPSGHATTVVALAAAIGLDQGISTVTATAIGFAASVGWSSMATDRHWASDLVAGSAVGLVSALLAGAADRRAVGARNPLAAAMRSRGTGTPRFVTMA